jgi:hypothetical protein
MVTRLADSFLGLLRKNPEKHLEVEMTVFPRAADWNVLPGELLEIILNLVADPARTSLVSREFRRQSQRSYTLLLKEYATHPSLANLLPPGGAPTQIVQRLFLLIIREAKSCGIPINTIERGLLPLAPQRLARIRELTLPRLDDKYFFYRTVFQQINTQLAQTFDQMARENVFELSERSLGSRVEMLSSRPTKLNLGNHHLSYLPSLIRSLRALRELNLHHNNLTELPAEMSALTKLTTLALNRNPLSPENVRQVCLTLPKLRTVVIDNEQPALIEMFKTHFPNLQVQVIQILRVEEEI